ncbi:MAG: integration host factor subunit alpha [Candidatus Pelagibacter sp. TMED273]|nr:MAG: integration host factor subunit alpha [Candidatus Pelagibacter sp. TMED273]|tara:strand:- start:103 stop:414 length:312 start_codon:yes stop_codon:yes gene_type:complete
MRMNLTKKDIVNSLYMQIGFSKNICENLLNDIIELFIDNLKEHRKLKISKFGTFLLRVKKSRIGRNPKTKEIKTISNRTVVLFKPSNEFKKFLNNDIKNLDEI